MKYQYYYNNVPGEGPSRNNIIYTSLISNDLKTFVQWYYNDSEYHRGQNEVIDPALMEDKWNREVKYLKFMSSQYPDLVPEILDIDCNNQKIYLKIDGIDFWNRANCDIAQYENVVPDWQEQMLKIIKAHRNLGIWKFSMHPSSYFITDGKLKSINYFFAYRETEPHISIKDVESHIYSTRQVEIRKHIDRLGIKWDEPQSFELLNELCWQSFSNMYPADFIEKAKCIK